MLSTPEEVCYRRFEVHQQDGACIVRFGDSELCSIAITAELNDELIQLIESRLPRAIIFDLSEVQICSTGIISILLRTRRRLQVYGGRVLLCGLSQHVRHSFEMLQLDAHIFPLHDNWLDALSELSA